MSLPYDKLKGFFLFLIHFFRIAATSLHNTYYALFCFDFCARCGKIAKQRDKEKTARMTPTTLCHGTITAFDLPFSLLVRLTLIGDLWL